ncbi:hypothetical protein FXO38_14763 [Capsicum annuum]|nr:hypothetical protein FXO38_14763 [Capsicum annuum]KAF3666710.1 hypothetical protein FXO37_10390 [Capsicum annuum]
MILSVPLLYFNVAPISLVPWYYNSTPSVAGIEFFGMLLELDKNVCRGWRFRGIHGERNIIEEGTTDIVVLNSEEAIETGRWEVEDAELLNTQPQLMLQGKEKETSLWVQQNMVKLGAILGVDFQGNKEESLELLLPVDSCRVARRLETDALCKKTRIKGAQELKSLVALDVKFKSGGNRANGRNNSISPGCCPN